VASLRRTSPAIDAAREDFRWIWPQARFVFASGLLWAAGMHLYPWLIDVNAGHAAVGVWSACFTVAAVGNPLMQGTINVIGPSIARQFTLRPIGQFRRYVCNLAGGFILIMSMLAVPLAIFGDDIVRLLFGPAYAGHRIVVALLALALVARSAGYAFSRGLFALDRADLDLYTNAAPIVVLLLLGVPLTARFGAEGAAASLLIAQLLGTLIRGVFFVRVTRERKPAGRRDNRLTPAAAPAGALASCARSRSISTCRASRRPDRRVIRGPSPRCSWSCSSSRTTTRTPASSGRRPNRATSTRWFHRSAKARGRGNSRSFLSPPPAPSACCCPAGEVSGRIC
jgi:O-antigen/teichoic acid export membrane protein